MVRVSMPLQFLSHADDLVKVRQLLLVVHVPSLNSKMKREINIV